MGRPKGSKAIDNKAGATENFASGSQHHPRTFQAEWASGILVGRPLRVDARFKNECAGLGVRLQVMFLENVGSALSLRPDGIRTESRYESRWQSR